MTETQAATHQVTTEAVRRLLRHQGQVTRLRLHRPDRQVSAQAEAQAAAVSAAAAAAAAVAEQAEAAAEQAEAAAEQGDKGRRADLYIIV